MLELFLDPTSPILWVFLILFITIPLLIFGRPFMAYIHFVYPNAKYEAIGNPYITVKALTGLIDTKEVSSFIESLNAHRDYQIEGETIKEIQASLDQHFITTLTMIQHDAPDKLHGFFKLFIKKKDLELIRHAVKAKLFAYVTPMLDTHPGSPEIQHLLQDITDTASENLPDLLRKHGFSSLVTTAVAATTPDALKIDTAFDQWIITKFRDIPLPRNCQKARDFFVSTWIDTLNIIHVLRAKQLGYSPKQCKTLFLGEGREIASWKYTELTETNDIPQIINALEGTSYYPNLKDAIEAYHKEKSISLMEQAVTNQFMHHLRDISLAYYQNLGPLLRFTVSKEYEIANLKIIAKGIKERLSTELIKPLLTTSEGIA